MDLKNFKSHRPVDPSDPGFSIVGVKLRWISGRGRERSDSRDIWTPLRKSSLSKELISHIERYHPNAFSDGDTIRRGDGELVLAYATAERASAHRSFLDSKTKDQASRARIMPQQQKIGDGSKDFAKIETYEESAGSIPSKFLKDNKTE